MCLASTPPCQRTTTGGRASNSTLSPEDYATQASTLDELLRDHLPPPLLAILSILASPILPTMARREPKRIRRPCQSPACHRHGGSLSSRNTLPSRLTAELSAWDWLALPEQKLLEVTAGEVFHDGLGTLNQRARSRCLLSDRRLESADLAAQWQRIAEEEAFVGRTGDVGDEVGSWIVAARTHPRYHAPELSLCPPLCAI